MLPPYLENLVLYIRYKQHPKNILLVSPVDPRYPVIIEPGIDWYLRTVYEENVANELDYPSGSEYKELKVTASDPELFVVNDVEYDEILLFLGDKIHWLFIVKDRPFIRLEGKADIPLTYCSCCMEDRCSKIVFKIIEHIKKNP